MVERHCIAVETAPGPTAAQHDDGRRFRLMIVIAAGSERDDVIVRSTVAHRFIVRGAVVKASENGMASAASRSATD